MSLYDDQPNDYSCAGPGHKRWERTERLTLESIPKKIAMSEPKPEYGRNRKGMKRDSTSRDPRSYCLSPGPCAALESGSQARRDIGNEYSHPISSGVRPYSPVDDRVGRPTLVRDRHV